MLAFEIKQPKNWNAEKTDEDERDIMERVTAIYPDLRNASVVKHVCPLVLFD